MNYSSNNDSYVCRRESAGIIFGDDMKKIAQAVTNRYMAENPVCDFAHRVYIKNDGIEQLPDYRWKFDFDKIFPDAAIGQFCYAFTKIECKKAQSFIAWLNTNCPVKIYVNGKMVHKSNIIFETNDEKKETLQFDLNEGENIICLELKKVNSGFCCSFGGAYEKWGLINYLVPLIERNGMWGFVYTSPADNPIVEIPDKSFSEQEFSYELYPALQEKKYEASDGEWYVAKTNIASYAPDASVTIRAKTDIILYQNNNETEIKKGECKKIKLKSGSMILKCLTNGEGRGFEIENIVNTELRSPLNVQGTSDPFIYIGAYNGKFILEDFLDNTNVIKEKFWTSQYENGVIRPFLESDHFGRWNYQIGVTLYGFLEAQNAFDCNEVGLYAREHINQCVNSYRYSLWDKGEYTVPHINHQLTDIDMLDDCGSFANAMLAGLNCTEVSVQREIADMVADYMYEKQEKTEDGVFCRLYSNMEFMQKTLWTDDLYMSVPFLSRYYKLTGEKKYFDLAALQYEIIAKYLLRDNGIYSHVYSLRYNKPNMVSWGRANGWVLFSLSELLSVADKKFEQYDSLLNSFQSLCKSLLSYQDNGMWHQVIDRFDSYRETSCTAMIAAAFARGVLNDWLEDNEGTYAEAAYTAWKAISTECIDYHGNVYGVCKGSGFSFNVDYYKDELPYVVNDTHGVGIVLLAAAQVQKLLNR